MLDKQYISIIVFIVVNFVAFIYTYGRIRQVLEGLVVDMSSLKYVIESSLAPAIERLNVQVARLEVRGEATDRAIERLQDHANKQA